MPNQLAYLKCLHEWTHNKHSLLLNKKKSIVFARAHFRMFSRWQEKKPVDESEALC